MVSNVRLRLIGDVHGKAKDYYKLIREVPYTIQVGDLGFADTYETLRFIDPARDRMIEGNHDDYDNRCHFRLGEFGVHTVPNFGDIFFVRGAWSIDCKWRIAHERKGGDRIWWEQEELSIQELNEAIRLYKEVKPDFVISHDCPHSINLEISDPQFVKGCGYEWPVPTRTSLALQTMFEAHQPQYWIFGHYHKSWVGHRDGTEFRCLAELEHLDFTKRLIPLNRKKDD